MELHYMPVMFKGILAKGNLRRIQIRETIKSHLRGRGSYIIGYSVLSLFFIDEVAKYRQYDDNGDQVIWGIWRDFQKKIA